LSDIHDYTQQGLIAEEEFAPKWNSKPAYRQIGTKSAWLWRTIPSSIPPWANYTLLLTETMQSSSNAPLQLPSNWTRHTY